jgi:hypothetical protein
VSEETVTRGPLRRISVRAVVQVLLFGFAAYTILEAAAGVDWGDVLSTIGDASIAWIVAGFVVAQLPRLTQSVSTLGSVPVSLPFGPVYAMQLTTSYMNVALPSNLARMAVNIRFFRRQGLSAPTAVASGAIDSFASTAVQGVLLGVLLIVTEASISLDLDLSAPSGWRTVLWILLAALVLSVAAFAIVRRLRNSIVERVSRWWPDVRTRARRSSRVAQARAAAAREPGHRAALCDRTRPLRTQLRRARPPR